MLEKRALEFEGQINVSMILSSDLSETEVSLTCNFLSSKEYQNKNTIKQKWGTPKLTSQVNTICLFKIVEELGLKLAWALKLGLTLEMMQYIITPSHIISMSIKIRINIRNNINIVELFTAEN